MASPAATTAAQKPLPAIPSRRNVRPLTTLTVDADAHLRRFLDHAIREDSYLSRLEDADSRRELWAGAIAGALTDLGDRVDRGGWLAGIRRAWRTRRARQVEQRKKDEKERAEKAEAEEKATKEGDAKDQDKSRRSRKQSKETDKGLPLPPTPPSASQEKLQDTDRRALALKQLQELASKPVLPRPKPSSKYLLLTLVPYGMRPLLPAEDMGFDLVPSNVGCIFSAEVFSLPSPASNTAADERHVLYGLEEWDVETSSPDADQLRLVGGTFCFKGVTAREEHEAVSRVLRLALFIHLSLILEQHLLADSRVRLEFPKPQLSPTIPSPASPGVHRQPTLPTVPKRGHRYRESLSTSPTVLWSFVSKKTENLLHRAANARPHINMVRHESLDLPTTVFEGQQFPRSSQETSPINRIRRFSFFGADGPPVLLPKDEEAPPEKPFSNALEQLQVFDGLLSTSPGVSLPVPSLLRVLADKEQQGFTRRLTGEERTGLSSLLIWEGKEPNGKGLKIVGGLNLFVRQQDFSTLYSEHVPTLVPLPDSRASSSSSMPSSQEPPVAEASDELTTSADPPAPQFATCGERRWSTFVFNDWSSSSYTSDKRLGEVIENLTLSADESCSRPGCTFKRGDHERRWIHNGFRVRAKVETLESEEDKSKAPDEEDIRMWLSCTSCGKKSAKQKISDGTYLLSFAKFLELLVYSPSVCTPYPAICQHTTPPPETLGLPASRLNIVRHFSHRSHMVTFSLSLTEDIYEVRLPRLQIVKSHGEKEDRRSIEAARKSTMDDEKKALRKEIMGWWQDVGEHMDRLEDVFGDADDTLNHKTLPRLPSTDDNDESIESTPKAKDVPLPPVPSSYPTTSVGSSSETNLAVPRPPLVRAKTSVSALRQSQQAQRESDLDCVQKLSTLRHTFQRTEQSLYAELLQTPTSSLNDVRRSFHSAARGAARRLAAWERKHQVSTVDGEPAAEKLCQSEPEWWGSGCHAVPGGNVVVRENDWGSIIAFTLSSVDYKKELASLSVSKPPNGSRPSHELVASTPPPQSSTSGSSFFASGGYKLFKSSAALQPDPDDEGVVWHEPEPHTATITRKEHPRDPTGILSLPSVLRHKPGDAPGLSPSRLTNLVLQARSASSSERTPPSAYAKPDVQLNMQPADGLVSGLPEAAQVVDKILHDVDAAGLESPTRSLSDSMNSNSSAFVESHVRRADAASLESKDSGSTIGPSESDAEKRPSVVPPPLPPKDARDSSTSLKSSSSSALDAKPSTPRSTSPKPGGSSFLSSTLTSGIASAMRLVLNPSETIKPAQSPKTHHALLNADSLPIDERPHIKYDWTIGKRLKFSCTVYYAKQFDGLRKRCSIEDVFLKSLERSANWAADGGKSKSNFWKTSDNRYIIKTLVNAWNVGDLQVLIELAPSYFRYMDSTATKPSALAKVLGFYTVEIRNLENGTSQAKADLLVMENLFYDQKITRTFDLKGIHGRKVKPSNNSSSISSPKTLFDGEWIEGQQRALILLRPYSKLVLQEAVRNDSDFLSRSSIMDYSLLLGLDEGRKQVVCGLVDMIGSYTFAKTLEYKVKQGLNPSGKEVTVMPPNEYQERFVNAMDSYFLACPDKWSRPWDETKTRLPTDVWDLRCPL
ncbi:hypothetical protein OE88DRAFT_1799856 [Heliocybe sulcata]|uniref:PIPK domain-containing protein n=1 Tax=Heliocybe sulcata TaxID=5364 RepID=A0A5C3N0G6_9AGAM|nr:hypothetical protein OE88DRAFT_1799856 [Heliocybe sulcata]